MSFKGVSSIWCLLKGFSVIWVTDIGVSVRAVFYRGVDLGVSIIGDVYLKGGIYYRWYLNKKNTHKLFNSQFSRDLK